MGFNIFPHTEPSLGLMLLRVSQKYQFFGVNLIWFHLFNQNVLGISRNCSKPANIIRLNMNSSNFW